MYLLKKVNVYMLSEAKQEHHCLASSMEHQWVDGWT